MKKILILTSLLLSVMLTLGQSLVTDTIYYSDGAGGYIKVATMHNYNTTAWWPRADTVNGSPNQTLMTRWAAQNAIDSIGGLIAAKISTATAAATYYPLTNPSGYITSASISGKLNISDTAAMLAGYLRKSDTAAMLTNYVKKNFLSAGVGIGYNVGTGVITNTAPDQTVTIASGAGISVTGSYPNFTVAASAPTLDTLSSARAFNTAFRMSTTKYVDVEISASISCNLTLTGGQSGEVIYETSPDASTWTQKGKIVNSSTGTVVVGIATTAAGGSGITLSLAPGDYWRARTNNVSGTPVFTMNQGAKKTYN